MDKRTPLSDFAGLQASLNSSHPTFEIIIPQGHLLTHLGSAWLCFEAIVASLCKVSCRDMRTAVLGFTGLQAAPGFPNLTSNLSFQESNLTSAHSISSGPY